MAEKIKKANHYLLILFLVGLMIGFNFWTSQIKADDVSTSVDVGNTAPTIAAISINGGANINLLEDSTVDIMASASITDENGCTDVQNGGGVKAIVYEYNVANASCSHDDNNCYDADIVSCSWQSTAGNTCNYECTASSAMQYYANSTSATSSASAEEWALTIIASDSEWADVTSNSWDPAANGGASVSVDIELLLGLAASAAVDYDEGGTLTPGAESNNIETGTRNTGNRAMNPLVSGIDMTGVGTIDVSHEQYSLIAFTVDGGTSLSGTPTTLDTNTSARTDDANASDDQIFWALFVPIGQTPGAYSGTNTLTADAD